MFDIGFSELFLIALVALIVLGPEKLPQVARTAGRFIGRMQRYVSDIKQEVSQELELDELHKLRSQIEEQARLVESQARLVETRIREEEGKVHEGLEESYAWHPESEDAETFDAAMRQAAAQGEMTPLPPYDDRQLEMDFAERQLSLDFDAAAPAPAPVAEAPQELRRRAGAS
jgi:sec-independent protein translocase protein TatB